MSYNGIKYFRTTRGTIRNALKYKGSIKKNDCDHAGKEEI